MLMGTCMSDSNSDLMAFTKRLIDKYPDLGEKIPLASTDPKEIGDFIIQNVTDGTRYDWLKELVALGTPVKKGIGFGFIGLAAAGAITAIALIYGVFVSSDFLNRVSEPGAARGLITFLFAFATIAVVIITVIATFWVKIEEVDQRGAFAKEILAIMIGIMGTILGFYFGAANPEAVPPSPPATTPPAVTAPAG